MKFWGGSALSQYHGMWSFLHSPSCLLTFVLTPRKHLDPLAFESQLFFLKSFLDSDQSLYSSLFRHLMVKATAPHSSTLAWKIPWMEEPGRLQFIGSHSQTWLKWLSSSSSSSRHLRSERFCSLLKTFWALVSTGGKHLGFRLPWDHVYKNITPRSNTACLDMRHDS